MTGTIMTYKGIFWLSSQLECSFRECSTSMYPAKTLTFTINTLLPWFTIQNCPFTNRTHCRIDLRLFLAFRSVLFTLSGLGIDSLWKLLVAIFHHVTFCPHRDSSFDWFCPHRDSSRDWFCLHRSDRCHKLMLRCWNSSFWQCCEHCIMFCLRFGRHRLLKLLINWTAWSSSDVRSLEQAVS